MSNYIKTTPITSMKGAFSVEGLNVVVTGGNRGIGRGIVQAFSELGANVVILCRNGESGEKAVSELAGHPGKHACIPCDISVREDVLNAVEQTVKLFGGVDVLVNNAGVSTVGTMFGDDDLKEWHRVIGTDLDGVAFTIQQFAKKMIQAGKGGSIINISSVGGVSTSYAKQHPKAPYNTAKAGVNHLTRYLAMELGDYGIRVNAIGPGLTHSDLDKDLPEEKVRSATAAMPTHRFGEPIEIGALCVYLASPAGNHVTGTVYLHDGGYSLL